MSENPYESDTLLQQYLVFHYARKADQFPYGFGGSDALDFPTRCVSEGLDFESINPKARALDLGCAVGRSSFELARHSSEVIGIDYSAAFIEAANALKVDGRISVMRQDEGSVRTQIEIHLDDSIDRARVHFETGDAQHLREDLGQFDFVLACNLICRLPKPKLLLNRLPQLVRPGGQLFITTPFTWLEEYTPRDYWLGEGAKDSFTGLQAALEPAFSLECVWDMPFLIREHPRKYQYSIAQASRWRRSTTA
ncbi:MAG: Ubiquinone biosynthesis O-methyltransferase [Opitutia bacterium UBA7350]|nr:MAG: Ubiquinone biosynthesis O-methyltransferase [Opitutae bacterium UBA7350]